MSDQPINNQSVAAAAQVYAASQGKDTVGSAIGSTVAQANPYYQYAQLGVQGLQALGTLGGGGGPNGGGSVSTPNFNNGPTAIISFGSGSVNSSANPTNTQSATQPSTTGGNALAGIFSGISGTVALVIGGIAALIILKKAKA